ncbi:calsequestrin-1-like [Centruroides vittatus]|uniref:calsequestrin-1-like n=1 Tax=Centruroides vittatus TaxID=120091 RepID=UPI00350F5CB0
MSRLSLGLVILLFSICHGQLLTYLQLPKHDGVKRVCTIGADNFTSVVSSAEIVVVAFTTTHQSTGCSDDLDSFTQVTAQVLRKRNVLICEADVSVIKEFLADEQLKSGDVYIYKNARKYRYFGHRSANSLLSFILKLNSTQINIITGKLDKIAFDAVEQPRVVGFFMKNTADYKAFEDASSQFSPEVPFYVVFDRTVAKHLKLDTVGQINLYRSLEKTPIPCPANPASVEDVRAFIQGHKGAVLTKLTEHNLHDPSLFDENRILVLSIGEQQSPIGAYFYRLLSKIIRNNTNNTEFQQLNIVWIEPDTFPAMHIMMDVLESTLGIPPILPAFGTVNLTTNENAWFNTSLLNTTGDKNAEKENIQLLSDWLSSVINKTVQTVKLVGRQSFLQLPQSQSVNEGDSVTLECVVENPIGDCVWLKDGRNIGYNFVKHKHLQWVGDTSSGVCSLRIISVEKSRDEGQWVCEITGDEENPTIISTPVKLTVVPLEKLAVKTEEL